MALALAGLVAGLAVWLQGRLLLKGALCRRLTSAGIPAAPPSAAGVWNKYGGRLAWDQRAIVGAFLAGWGAGIGQRLRQACCPDGMWGAAHAAAGAAAAAAAHLALAPPTHPPPGDDPNFRGRGNRSSGDIFSAAPNIDHSQEFVKRDVAEWMQWLRTHVGFDGWRLDFVKGFHGSHVKARPLPACLPASLLAGWLPLPHDAALALPLRRLLPALRLPCGPHPCLPPTAC